MTKKKFYTLFPFLYRKKKTVQARRYVHKSLGVKSFFEELNRRDINYVVLRWYDTLPVVEEDEDIDMLFEDSAIEKIEDLFTGNKYDGIPCDIYSASGLKGTDFRKMAYYPPKIAKEILENSLLFKEYIKVPSPKYYFLSMAYHAVYHKGYSSGIKTRILYDEKDCKKHDHDYTNILIKLGKDEGYILEDLSLETLHDLLKNENWTPPYDTLEKLSKKNVWVKDHILDNQPKVADKYKGLTVFIVREKGMNFLDEIRDIIFRNGFTILNENHINKEDSLLSTEEIRGGNWGKGPFAVSGGNPCYAIVAYDILPIEPSSDDLDQHVGLANKRILKTKHYIRKFINTTMSKKEEFNALHSADNPIQAFEYIKLVFGALAYDKKLIDIENKIDKLNTEFETKFPVISDLSKNTRRAKVELIDYNGKKAVCKTFKLGMDKYLNREIKIREELKDLNFVSTMLEYGSNYIVIEYYEPTQEDFLSNFSFLRKPKLYNINTVKKVIENIEIIKNRGFHLIDFQDENIIFDAKEGMKLIDFEVYYENNSDKDLNYTWYKLPKSTDADVPFGYFSNKRETYYTNIYYRFGIPLCLVSTKTSALLILITRLFLVPISSLSRIKIKIKRKRKK